MGAQEASSFLVLTDCSTKNQFMLTMAGQQSADIFGGGGKIIATCCYT